MNKTVGELLMEYHVMILSNALLSSNKNEDNINQQIASIKKNGISVKGFVKSYLTKEVLECPKVIKNKNSIIGIALKVGVKNNMSVYLTYISYNNENVFNITEEPTDFVTEVGNFPKEVVRLKLQLGITPVLSHLNYKKEDYKLVFERYSSTIRKMPENYFVAAVSETYNLSFDNQDVCVKDMNRDVVLDMWNRGLIPTKEPIK